MIAGFPDPGRLPAIAATVEQELTTARAKPGNLHLVEEPSRAELAALRCLATGLSRRETTRLRTTSGGAFGGFDQGPDDPPNQAMETVAAEHGAEFKSVDPSPLSAALSDAPRRRTHMRMVGLGARPSVASGRPLEQVELSILGPRPCVGDRVVPVLSRLVRRSRHVVFRRSTKLPISSPITVTRYSCPVSSSITASAWPAGAAAEKSPKPVVVNVVKLK